MRIASAILFLLLQLTVFAQKTQPIEFDVVRKGRKLPQELGAGRCAVIISTPSKAGTWKDDVVRIHGQLKRMRLDVVMYLHYLDYDASPTLTRKYKRLMLDRGISNVFLFRIEENKVKVLVGEPTESSGLLNFSQDAYFSEGPQLNDILYELALVVRRMDYPRQNFLIPDAPEIFSDVPLIKATEFPSYPSQLKRLPIGVTLFQRLPVDSAVLSQDQLIELHEYNQAVETKNRKLRAIFENYPYKYEFTEPIDDDEAYDKGYQFVLRNLHTSGYTIKKLLNIASESMETDYISIIPVGEDQKQFKTIPVDKTVYKFYIKQSISGDAYVGRYWDASEEWETALNSFLTHLQREFNK